ncbi:CinA family protein [Metallumcola ferriviriculae]|uniref:CinA family protein n=1 Tax=Metallumcola ferriviriculae TaxID=3039180 RepID=A0AAU0UJZ8_9FIRM|nr:CinA family protein [Desulfitibacteraceae bacterium MK1]
MIHLQNFPGLDDTVKLKKVLKTDSLNQVVGSILLEKNISVATAESCTGGLLAHKLTLVPGSSAYFPLGLVTYDNLWKERLLSISNHLLSARGAVSPEVAAAMAEGVRFRAETDLGVGITGIAGPGGGSMDKPVGLVYIAVANNTQTTVKRFHFHGKRQEIKENSARAALALMLDFLGENI